MGRKSKCISSTSSSSSSSCNPCSSSSSSSTSFVYCCKKYPKCKCSPIYYPNKCDPYPCNPCLPKSCPPYPCPPNPNPYPYPCPPNPYPCPPNPCGPCPPYPYPQNTCGTPYTSNSNIITSDTTLSSTSPNVNICNPVSSNITITLPSIPSGLLCCRYNKMFVISNISSTNTVTISVASGDSLTSSVSLSQGDSVTLYSVYISTGSYWIVA